MDNQEEFLRQGTQLRPPEVLWVDAERWKREKMKEWLIEKGRGGDRGHLIST